MHLPDKVSALFILLYLQFISTQPSKSQFPEEKEEKERMGSIGDLPVGVFPTLVPPSSSGHTEFHAWEISPDILTNLLQSSIRKEVDLIVLLRSIWAIVLRQYVESDGLCFKAGSMTSACSELDMLVYRAGISSHDTPEGIWRQQQITTGISAGGRNWEVNTGVFLLKLCSDRQWRARAMVSG